MRRHGVRCGLERRVPGCRLARLRSASSRRSVERCAGLAVLREVRACMRAAAFLAAQGGDRDHQADNCGVACSLLRRSRGDRARGRRHAGPSPSRGTPAARDRIGRTGTWVAVRYSTGQHWLTPPDGGRCGNILGSPSRRTRPPRGVSYWRADLRRAGRCRRLRRRPKDRRRRSARSGQAVCRPCGSAQRAGRGSAA